MRDSLRHHELRSRGSSARAQWLLSGRARIRSLVALLGVVVIGLILAFVAGSGSERPSGQFEEFAPKDLLTQFIKTHPELAATLRERGSSPQADFCSEVFVDFSSSMQGFSRPSAIKVDQVDSPWTNSEFHSVIKAFSDRSRLESFYGFGSEQNSVGTKIVELEDPFKPPATSEFYVRRSNDFAGLLEQFKSRPLKCEKHDRLIQRIVITDGVQSQEDPDLGNALGETALAFQQWIRDGGLIEIRAFAGYYLGDYVSQILRVDRQEQATIQGKLANRPFVVISFLTGKEVLEGWEELWNSYSAKNISRDGGRKAIFNAEQERVPPRAVALKELPKEARGATDWRSASTYLDFEQFSGSPDIESLYLGKVKSIKRDPNFFPICFAIPDLTTADREALTQATGGIEAKIEVFEPSRVPVDSPNNRKLVVTEGEEEPISWEIKKTIDLGKPNPEEFQFVVEPMVDGSERILLLVWCEIPPEGGRTFYHLNLRYPDVDHVQTTSFEDISTLDDSVAENLDKIYNFQTLIEQLNDGLIVRGNSTSSGILIYR
jgi:hypothetical protein